MQEGICQVSKEIGTAPNQNPDIEYNVIGDEETVFCEDEQCEMPESDCEKIGELYYSKEFLASFNREFEIAFGELEEIGSIQADFFGQGRFDSVKVNHLFGFLSMSLTILKSQFVKIGMEADND